MVSKNRRAQNWVLEGVRSAFGVASHGSGSPRTNSEAKSEPSQNRAL